MLLMVLGVFLAECRAVELADRLLQGGPAGWKRLSLAYEEFRANVSVTEKFVNKMQSQTQITNSKLNFVYKQKMGHQLLEVLNNDPKLPSLTWSYNRQYGFQLQSVPQSGPERIWTIKEADPRFTDRINLPTSIDEATHSLFKCPWTIATLPLSTMVASSGFQIKNITQMDETSAMPATVVVEFNYVPASGDSVSVREGARVPFVQAGPPDIGGVMTLIPEYDWALMLYDVQVTLNLVGTGRTDPLHVSSKVEYALQEAPDGTKIPVPKRLSQTIEKKTLDRDVVCTVSDWVFEPVEDSEFTLSAYGLPEVTTDIPQPSIVRNLMVAANVCLVVALVIWLVVKKRKTA
jgi:hypothetical protein